ncbi:MAG: hypothetical protein ACK5VI_04315 [Opitutia bacterium]
MTPERIAISASFGPGNRYFVDTDGFVYARLKRQGVGANPRYHLWDGKGIFRVYAADLRKSIVESAANRLLAAVTISK